MTVAAVVVRWRGGDEVRRCLQSIADHGGPEVTRTILVDSGSGDGGAERIAGSLDDVELVALEENRSFAWAVNQGAERCDETLLLILNPDAELSRGGLRPLLEELDRRPDAAGAVPLLLGTDGSSQHRWQLRRLPGVARLALGLAGPPQFPAAPPGGPQQVEQPAAAAWLVRREVWEALGGLDPEFAPAWWEDVDFCARLQNLVGRPGFPAREGFRVVPAARVLHTGGSSVERLTEIEFLSAFFGNLLRYAARHHASRLGTVRAGLRLSLLARALIRPARGRGYLATVRTI